MDCPVGRTLALPAPPMVAGAPFVGNAVELIRSPLECLADAAASEGPVFRMRLFGLPVTVLSGPEAAPLVKLDSSGPLTRKGTFTAFSTQTSVDLFALQGPEHAAARSLLQRAYSRQGLGQYVPEIARDLEAHVRKSNAGTLEVTELCARLAVLGMAKAITPIDLAPRVDDVARFGRDVMSVIVRLRPSLIFWLPRFRAARRRLYRAVDEAIGRHESGEFADQARVSMIDALLEARTDGDQQLDTRQIRGACLYALCGAYTYLGPLAAFMIYETVRDRNLLVRVRSEIDEAFGEDLFDPLRFRQMSHLRATYFEALRRYPMVPGLMFLASRDFDFAGHRVPKGETVVVSSVPSQFDEAFYTKPFTFDHRRFHGGREASPYVGAYAPFGMAPRTCMAAGMVELLTLTTVAAVLRNLDLALVRPSYTSGASLRPLPEPPDGLPMLLRAIRDPHPTTRGGLDAIDLVDPFAHSVESTASFIRFDADPIKLRKGATIVAPNASGLFVVLDGELSIADDVARRTRDSIAAVAKPSWIPGFAKPMAPIFAPGDVIGYGARGTEACRYVATQPTRLLAVDAAAFEAALGESDLMARELGRSVQLRYMREMLSKALPGLDAATIESELSEFRVMHVEPGAPVFRQGDPADHVYVVLSGELTVTREHHDGSEEILGRLKAGEAFGEIGVLHRRPRGATVRCEGVGAVVLALARQTIDHLLADSPDARQGLALTAGQRLIALVEKLENRTP